MSDKLKMTLEQVLKSGFDTAFDKLCNDAAFAVRDRYALARTRRDINSHLDTYGEERVKAFKAFGEPEQDVLSRLLARLKADEKADAKRVEGIEKRIKMLEDTRAESWAIDPDNAEAIGKVEGELKELRTVEFDVFLDHKVALPENCSLTAADIEPLLDVVEEPA